MAMTILALEKLCKLQLCGWNGCRNQMRIRVVCSSGPLAVTGPCHGVLTLRLVTIPNRGFKIGNAFVYAPHAQHASSNRQGDQYQPQAR